MTNPRNETDRLLALREYQILDTLPDDAIDRLTQLASLLCETPVSLVTLLDENRQWFKSNVGMPGHETPRQVAFCQYVVANGAPLEVPNATLDERFQQNPLVTADPSIRFYAGYPLTDPQGYVLGSLCVIDQQPRQLSPHQHKALELLSHTVMDLIVERRNQQRQRQFDQLFVQANDLIAIAGHDGYFKTVNPAFERVLGWTSDELLGTEWYTWVHPEDRVNTRQIVEALTTKSVELTHRFRCQDGTYRHLHWVMSPEPGTDNRFAIIRDVTVQKQQEEDLQQTQQRLAKINQVLEQRVAERTAEIQQLSALQRAIFTHAGLAITVTNPDGLIQLVNPALESLTGYRSEELVGLRSPRLLRDPVHHRQVLAQLRAELGKPALADTKLMSHYLHQHQVFQGETTFLSKAGQKTPVYSTITGLYDEQQTLLGYVDVSVDISSLKRVETALRVSEERFQEIANHVGEIFWVRDIQSQRFLYVNPAYETMSGLSRADLYADPRDFLRFVVAQDHPRLLAVFQNPHPDSQLQFRVHHRSGQVHWLQARIVEVYDESGVLLRRIGVATDITAAMEKEQILEESLHKQRRLTAHQAHFITTASHMFRTPLTAMRTSVELAWLYLDRLPVSDASQPIHKHLAAITVKIDGLAALIRDTLSLESVEPGQSLVSWVAIDLVGLSESLIASQFGSYARQGRSVDVQVVGLPVPVAGDERLLESVLSHLLRNAFTYSAGAPRLRLSYEAGAVVVEVIDAGMGIPLDEQPYIFDRFFRARNASDFQGLGLGLAICQEQVSLLGGQLRVESAEGVGTTVRFQLGYAAS